MKKELRYKNRTAMADASNKIDGLRKGLSRAENRKVMAHVMAIDIAERVGGRRSPLYALMKKSKKSADKIIASVRAAKRKAKAAKNKK